MITKAADSLRKERNPPLLTESVTQSIKEEPESSMS